EASHDQTAQFAVGRILTHPRYDRSEIPTYLKMDESIHVFRNTGLFRISRWQTGPDLFGLGNSHAKHPWLEGSVLFDDRRALLKLRRVAGTDRLESLRSRQWGRA